MDFWGRDALDAGHRLVSVRQVFAKSRPVVPRLHVWLLDRAVRVN
jgi:hypothetical protein